MNYLIRFIIIFVVFVIFTIKLDFTKLTFLQVIYAAYYLMIFFLPLIIIKKIVFPRWKILKNGQITFLLRFVVASIFCVFVLILDSFKYIIFKNLVTYVEPYFICIILLFGIISIFMQDTNQSNNG